MLVYCLILYYADSTLAAIFNTAFKELHNSSVLNRNPASETGIAISSKIGLSVGAIPTLLNNSPASNSIFWNRVSLEIIKIPLLARCTFALRWRFATALICFRNLTERVLIVLEIFTTS